MGSRAGREEGVFSGPVDSSRKSRTGNLRDAILRRDPCDLYQKKGRISRPCSPCGRARIGGQNRSGLRRVFRHRGSLRRAFSGSPSLPRAGMRNSNRGIGPRGSFVEREDRIRRRGVPRVHRPDGASDSLRPGHPPGRRSEWWIPLRRWPPGGLPAGRSTGPGPRLV